MVFFVFVFFFVISTDLYLRGWLLHDFFLMNKLFFLTLGSPDHKTHVFLFFFLV